MANIAGRPCPSDADGQIAAVRGFNRFYTRKLGILEPKLLDSPFSLQEARILYEIAQRAASCTATDLVRELGLDAGLSQPDLAGAAAAPDRRAKAVEGSDRRQSPSSPDRQRRAAFAELDRRSHDDVAAMLAALRRRRIAPLIVGRWPRSSRRSGRRPQKPRGFLLRSHRPGDIGWVVSRHGALYAQEYGWDISFEALVAEITAQFINSYDPSREHCWIAEIDGEPVGSIFLVNGSRRGRQAAAAAGGQEGARARRRPRADRAMHPLRARCRLHARSRCGPRASWSPRAGSIRTPDSCCVATEPHRSFGQSLIGETWELQL